MKKAIKINVNGVEYQHEVEPRLLLVHYLRDVLNLTGTHVGCETSLCGACTIFLNDQAVKSCTMFAVQADGASVKTIEGLATNGDLHAVQEGFWERHGLQCGYCTPGFVMSLFEGYYRQDIRTSDQLDDQLCGNLCRCTGYRPIRDAAIRAFSDKPRKNGNDRFAVSLARPIDDLSELAYELADERFLRPATLEELLGTMAQFPEGKLIAGATELGL